jgi:ABC-type sugar transport system ATPase subunit
MAGAFGYEKENGHYEVGLAAGERALLPEVRNASDDELIIADGFSCQEQIEQQTDREAMHTAMVLQMAMRRQPGVPGSRPESQMVKARKRATRMGMVRAAAVLGIGALIGVLAFRTARGQRTVARLTKERF